MSRPEWVRTIDTVARPQALAEIQCCLDDLWSSHSEVPDDVRTHISVAAAEIATNIIENAAGGPPVRLQMQLCLTPEQIEVTFTDDGTAALVDLKSVALPGELADRGRGLAIAKELLDELSYRRDGIRNQWKLARRRIA